MTDRPTRSEAGYRDIRQEGRWISERLRFLSASSRQLWMPALGQQLHAFTAKKLSIFFGLT